MAEKKIKVLAVSGSLRSTSSNTTLVRWIQTLLPANIEYTVYDALKEIPPFDDSGEGPVPVTQWKQCVEEADGVLICSPEYAFGVPGVLKNALDWAVSSTVFSNKPVALITAASSGEKAHAAMLHTLTAIGTLVSPQTSLLISFIRSKLNKEGEVIDAGTMQQISALLNSFLMQIENSHLAGA